MSTIIGFSGKKKSGKDTAYKLLSNLLPERVVHRFAFADELKTEVAYAIHQSVAFIDLHKDAFRLILQGWGTDYRRKLCGEDYWLKKWMSKVEYVSHYHPEHIIIAPDVRFENEANIIRSHGGFVYRICAVGKEGMTENDTHDSEQDLLSIKPDHVLINDFRDINILKDQMQQVIKKLNL